jgi:nicotinamide mononucleotide adenylyltransferase
MSKKYAMYVGRWQNWHKGHEWLINQQLEKGKNVWVAIRDVAEDENNPKSSHRVMMDLMEEPFFQENIDRILVSIIPDIESFNYGRDVGYEVVYHHPPWDVAKISGTKIRNGEMNSDGTVISDDNEK